MHEIAVLLGVLFVYFAARGRYSQRRLFWDETRLVAKAGLCAVGLEILLGALLHDLAVRLPIMAVFLLMPVLATAANRFAKQALQQAAVWTQPVLVLGDEAGAANAQAALDQDRSLGYQVIGRIDPSTVLPPPNTQRLSSMLRRFGASRVLIAVDGGSTQRRLIEWALRERVAFTVMPTVQALPSFACETAQVFGHEARLLTFRDDLSRPLARMAKRAMDLGIAALLLVLVAPLFLAIIVANRGSGAPVFFFAHRRVGAGGRPFDCLKFSTMVMDSDRVLEEALAADPALAAEWSNSRKLARDPRVTPLGRFLRRTSLDELPQLINVLRQDMSLVGPRPIVEAEIGLYGDDIAQYYAIRPGLTGLWQVSGRSTTSYARRVELDVWYVNNWSIWNDLAVLLRTVPVVLCRQGAC